MLRILRTIEHGMDAVLQRVLFLGMAALIGVMTLQIVSRVFFSATSWSEELARFLLVWLTFLGATLAYQRGRHIAVTFVVERLPGVIQRLCHAATALVGIGFLLVIVVVGYDYMQMQSFQTSASLGVPMNYVYSVMPISAAIMIWYALVDLIEVFAGTDPEAGGAGADTAEAPDE